jgi:hypothetical protein
MPLKSLNSSDRYVCVLIALDVFNFLSPAESCFQHAGRVATVVKAVGTDLFSFGI